MGLNISALLSESWWMESNADLKLMPTPKRRLEEKEIYTKGVIDSQN